MLERQVRCDTIYTVKNRTDLQKGTQKVDNPSKVNKEYQGMRSASVTKLYLIILTYGLYHAESSDEYEQILSIEWLYEDVVRLNRSFEL